MGFSVRCIDHGDALSPTLVITLQIYSLVVNDMSSQVVQKIGQQTSMVRCSADCKGCSASRVQNEDAAVLVVLKSFS